MADYSGNPGFTRMPPLSMPGWLAANAHTVFQGDGEEGEPFEPSRYVRRGGEWVAVG